jgi:hypothetical protein
VVKQPGHEGDHSPQSDVEVKNECTCEGCACLAHTGATLALPIYGKSLVSCQNDPKCIELSPWILIVEVHDGVTSKSCCTSAQHEWQRAHCCKRC